MGYALDVLPRILEAFLRYTLLATALASALAAVLSGRLELRGLRVGVTLSGGNVDAERFARLMSSAPPDSAAAGP